MKTFGQKLIELRKNNNLTQEELASKLFVSRQAISKWEQDRVYPSIESLKLIAKLFNVSIDELIDDRNIEEKKEQVEKSEVLYQNKKTIWGMLAGVFGVLTFYLVVAVIVIFLIMNRIAQETGASATLFDEWYQVLLLTISSVFMILFIGCIVMKVIDRPSVKVAKEKKTIGNVLLNKSAWVSISTLFVVAFPVLMVGESIVRVNESNINYGLGINPYITYTDPNSNVDTNYFPSDFYKDDGSYDDQALRDASLASSLKVAREGMCLLL